MERVTLAPGLTLSRLVYGMWRLGEDTDTSPGHIRAKIEACLDQGITTLDQADIYGGYQAEALLGAALTPALRQRLEIVTKCGIVAPEGRHAGARVKHYDTSAAHIRAALENSLRLMGTDHVDLLLIHRPDPFMDAAETGAALDALVAEGKTRAVGVSNFRPWDVALLQSAMSTPLVTNQIELSLLQTAPLTNGDLAYHHSRGEPVMAWSPLGGGALFGPQARALHDRLAAIGRAAGVDAGAVAIAWLLAHPARILPVLGTNDLDRIARIGHATRVPMDRETWFELYTQALGHDVP
jgi:predicted oxidoreductase